MKLLCRVSSVGSVAVRNGVAWTLPFCSLVFQGASETLSPDGAAFDFYIGDLKPLERDITSVCSFFF